MKIGAMCVALVAFVVFGASSALGDPADPNDMTVAESVIDQYVCYKAKDLKSPALEKLEGVDVVDAQGTYEATLKKLFLVCEPADAVYGPGADPNDILNADALLCGYKIKPDPKKLEPAVKLEVTSQYQGHNVEIKKVFVMLEPCDLVP